MKIVHSLSLIVALIFITNISTAQIQAEHYVDGPMVGSVTDSSTSVNIIVGKGSQTDYYHVELKNVTTNTMVTTNNTKEFCISDSCLYTSIFSGLIPSNEYYAILFKNNIAFDSTRSNFTVPDNVVNDFSFITGSCAYQYPVGHAKFVRENIFDQMTTETDAEFMLWLGDQIYFPYNDLDQQKMFDTYMFYKTESAQRRNFMKQIFHFGIWDDHDYSYDNGAADFSEKEYSSEMYKAFWPNSGYEHQDDEGTYGSYKYEDIEFFLTDVRYYKSRYIHLGETQMDWLKDKLLNSTATFKFVEIGSAVVYPWTASGSHETSFYQTGEREELFDFIYANDISGVIFLTGDKHKSYFGQFNPGCNSTYPLYDFMCSPLTSNAGNSDYKYADLFTEINSTHNYGKIDISGPVGNRVCTMTAKDASGAVIYTMDINENDVKPSTNPDIIASNFLNAQYNLTNNANDNSGNGFNATISGATPTFDRWGTNNAAYLFNSYPGTLDIPNTVLDSKNNFSASFWIKPTINNCGILSAASSTVGNEVLVFYGATKKISLNIKNVSISCVDSISFNEWSHIAVTRNGTTGDAAIYINGNIEARGVLPTGPLEVVSNALLFGNDQDGAGGGNLDPNQQFKGILDDIAFYDEELCQLRINELYSQGLKDITSLTNDTICEGGNVTFTTTGTANGSYNWYKTKEGNSLISNSDTIYNTTINETTTYWIAADNSFTESERVAATIYVAPKIYTDIDSLTYPSSLSSWFPFDANAAEYTQNYGNGVVNGPVLTSGRFGNANSAYQFANYQDLIVLPSEAIDGAEEFSLTFWMKTNGSGDGIVSAASSIGGNELLVYLSAAGSFHISMNEGTKVYSSPIVNDNQWHHVALSLECKLGLGILYIDGQRAITTNDYFKAGELEVPAGAFVLGNDQDNANGGGFSTTQQYTGALDDFKTYRRALTEQEIIDIFNDNTMYKEAFSTNFNALTFCEGDDFTLNMSPLQDDVTYYLIDNTSQVVGTGMVSNDSVYFDQTINATGSYSILAKNTMNCEKPFTETYAVTSVTSPTPSIVVTDDSLCSDITGDVYNWLLNGQPLSNQSCVALTADGSYSVYIINNPNCISDTSTTHSYFVSVDELKSLDFTISPVPAQKELNILFENNQLRTEYKIIDLSGKIVIEGVLNNTRNHIDISRLPKGIYSFLIITENNKIAKVFEKM